MGQIQTARSENIAQIAALSNIAGTPGRRE